MKPDIHPDYHDVIFVDSATGTEWTSRSTVTSKETREIDGVEVPVIRLEISAVSHPFWTGTQRELDADGKIDRFRKRYGGVKAGSANAPDEAPAVEEPVAVDEAPAEAEASQEASEEPAAEAQADGQDEAQADQQDETQADEEAPGDEPAPSESA